MNYYTGMGKSQEANSPCRQATELLSVDRSGITKNGEVLEDEMTNVVKMFKKGKKADFPNYRTVI